MCNVVLSTKDFEICISTAKLLWKIIKKLSLMLHVQIIRLCNDTDDCILVFYKIDGYLDLGYSILYLHVPSRNKNKKIVTLIKLW